MKAAVFIPQIIGIHVLANIALNENRNNRNNRNKNRRKQRMNETTEQISQTAHEIQARIQQLSDLSGTNLKNEMDDLKLCF
jgi:uncharacterized protein (UPF0254 family)